MKPEINKLWVEALRSLVYPQGRGRLATMGGLATIPYINPRAFCCLGVLCQLHFIHVGHAKGVGWTNNGEYLGESHTLPQEVVEWAGMQSNNGVIPGVTYMGLALGSNSPRYEQAEVCLWRLNDDVLLNFPEIADVIEKYADFL